MTGGGSVQVTGDVAKGVVGGLTTQPVLLTVVTLNVVAIAVAGYFLLNVSRAVHEERMQLIDRCIASKEKA